MSLAIRAALLAAILGVAPALADDYALPDPIMTPGASDVPASIFCAQPSRERRQLARGVSAAIARPSICQSALNFGSDAISMMCFRPLRSALPRAGRSLPCRTSGV